MYVATSARDTCKLLP